MKFKLPKLIGVVHLPPLPGAPGHVQGGSPVDILNAAGKRALDEALLFKKLGFEGVILENFGDVPFYPDEVPPETVASLALIAGAVCEATDLVVGINVLRNDARSALAIASVTGCHFIRVNVLSGVAATDQGLVQGKAHELLREKKRLGSSVAILADVQVKHARTLSSDSIELMVEEAVLRAGASGVIVSGSTTGRAVEQSDLVLAAKAAKKANAPLYIGSGATPENVQGLKKYADGIIVSSSVRKNGKAGLPLDQKRMRDFVNKYLGKGQKK